MALSASGPQKCLARRDLQPSRRWGRQAQRCCIMPVIADHDVVLGGTALPLCHFSADLLLERTEVWCYTIVLQDREMSGHQLARAAPYHIYYTIFEAQGVYHVSPRRSAPCDLYVFVCNARLHSLTHSLAHSLLRCDREVQVIFQVQESQCLDGYIPTFYCTGLRLQLHECDRSSGNKTDLMSREAL